jgi:vitamin B12 transporter
MPHGACGGGSVLSSVLSSMRPRCAVAAVLCIVVPWVAAADEPVIVTASREPVARHQLAADVVVIDAERIRASGADSLEDLLRREAGVQLSRSGPPGQPAGVLIRGAASGQTLLLVDGVRVGSATLGAPEFDLLSLRTIERIEVLRGPGSSLFGADAIGGVVQIFTRRGSGAPRAALRLAAGGYGAGEASLAADAKVGDFDLAAGLAYETLDGVSAVRPNDAFGNHNPDDDGYSRRSGALQIGWEPVAGRRIGFVARQGRLDAQYDGSEFPPPTFVQDSSPDFRNRGTTRQLALDGRATLGRDWVLSARLASDDSERTIGANAPDRYATVRRQGMGQISWLAAADQQLTLAVERVEESAQSTAYLADVARDNEAVVLAYAGAAGPVQINAEARHDSNTAYGDANTGRLGLRWPVTNVVSLRALAGTSFRAPSFNDLVFPNYGVPTLQPEHGRSIEGGIDARLDGAALGAPGGAAEFSLTLYRQELSDMIAYESDPALCPPDPSYAFGCARNLQNARLQGATLSFAGSWQSWTLRGTLDWLDTEDEATGAPLPRRAAHQQSVALRWRGGAWEAGAELLHVGSRPDAGVTLPAETTLDLQASWRFAPGWLLQARLANATDEDLQPARDYQGLGRQAWLVLRWEGGW